MATRSSWSNANSALTLDRRTLLQTAAAVGLVLPAGLPSLAAGFIPGLG
jgi:hypothetical protein